MSRKSVLRSKIYGTLIYDIRLDFEHLTEVGRNNIDFLFFYTIK